jgi:hypothetical protein
MGDSEVKKAKVKGSTKGGRGRKYCKGCGLYYDASVFQINEPYCPDDSTAVKRLQRTATAQGKAAVDLFSSIRKDEVRLQNTLAKYHEDVGNSDSFRKPSWSWAQCEEPCSKHPTIEHDMCLFDGVANFH